MRILVDVSSYAMMNHGDTAMLCVAVKRLFRLWPESHISVFTETPQALTDRFPNAHPLAPIDRENWTSETIIPYRLRRFVRRYENRAVRTDAFLRDRYPTVWNRLYALKKPSNGVSSGRHAPYRSSLENAELVVATGGGFVNDCFPGQCERVLRMLLTAAELGKPVAMLGQGIGPLKSTRLRRLASRVFPHLELLSLRESKFSLPLARSLGARTESIVTTGDDALEFAYSDRQTALGSAIGVNVRVAPYSGIDSDSMRIVKRAVHTVASEQNAPLISVPISLNRKHDDVAAAKEIVDGYANIIGSHELCEYPEDTIEKIRVCRMVVTGSYHAGVFALAQGVPVVALVANEYYRQKFEGLSEQFGGHCNVVRLDLANPEDRLTRAVRDTYAGAEGSRQRILEHARQQMTQGKQAYDRLLSVVYKHASGRDSPCR